MHEATARLLRYFDYEHLPAALQDVSRDFHALAHKLVEMPLDGPELTVALRKLLEAGGDGVGQAFRSRSASRCRTAVSCSWSQSTRSGRALRPTRSARSTGI